VCADGKLCAARFYQRILLAQSTINTVLNENMQNIIANANPDNTESTTNSIHAVIRKANYLASAKERQAEKRNQARFGV
jgi:hypothetical protein